MSMRSSSCTVVAVGEITANSPKVVANNRVCISITLKNKKDKNTPMEHAFVNCYFSEQYVSKILEYLKPGRIVSVTGEISFSTFNEKSKSNNIDVQGNSINLIDNPWKNENSNNNKYEKDNKYEDNTTKYEYKKSDDSFEFDENMPF